MAPRKTAVTQDDVDERPSRAAVAVAEGVDRFKLGVYERGMRERWKRLPRRPRTDRPSSGSTSSWGGGTKSAPQRVVGAAVQGGPSAGDLVVSTRASRRSASDTAAVVAACRAGEKPTSGAGMNVL